MCFICNDTKIVYVPAYEGFNTLCSWDFSVAVGCPLCTEQEEKSILKIIEDAIKYDFNNNQVIRYIKLTKIDFDRLKTLVYLGYNPQRYYTYTFEGIPLLIDDTINKLEIGYYDE